VNTQLEVDLGQHEPGAHIVRMLPEVLLQGLELRPAGIRRRL
jgi:hypothetical protein